MNENPRGWITGLLREAGLIDGSEPGDFSITPVGEDSAFASRLFRVELPGEADPPTVICKVGEGESGAREALFYRDVGANAGVRVPRCYHAVREAKTTRLVLEDLVGARFPDYLDGCSADEAAQVVDGLADLHASWWQRAQAALDWAPTFRVAHAIDRLPSRMPTFLERHGAEVPDAVRKGTERVGERHRSILEPLCEPLTLLHADSHLDNVAFDDAGVVMFDWQNVCIGHPAVDLALFIVGSLAIEHRRGAERELLARYLERASAEGVADLRKPALDQAYRATILRWWLGTVNGLGRDDAGSWQGRQLEVAREGVRRWVAAIEDHEVL